MSLSLFMSLFLCLFLTFFLSCSLSLLFVLSLTFFASVFVSLLVSFFYLSDYLYFSFLFFFFFLFDFISLLFILCFSFSLPCLSFFLPFIGKYSSFSSLFYYLQMCRWCVPLCFRFGRSKVIHDRFQNIQFHLTRFRDFFDRIYCTSLPHTVIRLCQVSAKFGTCNVVGLKRTLVEAKLFTFTLECTHSIFNKCPIKTLRTTTEQMPNLALVETKRITVHDKPLYQRFENSWKRSPLQWTHALHFFTKF